MTTTDHQQQQGATQIPSTMAMKQHEQGDTATSSGGRNGANNAVHDDSSTARTSRVTDPQEQAQEQEYNPLRVVLLDQMEAVMHLLVHPVWIFDVKDRKMRWGNRAAQELFNASSLEDFVSRDFTQMSPSVVSRNAQLIQRCGLGLVTVDMWTFYPKGQAKTVRSTISGIRLLDDQTDPAVLPHICILVEGVSVEQRDLDNELLRGVEMLRHLPIAVCQFDMHGNCMFQNPEATLLGDNALETDSHDEPDVPDDDSLDKSPQDSSTITNRKRKPADSDLLGRFVDATVGKRVLQQVREKFPTTVEKQPVSDSCIELEAMLHTKRGRTWSAIQLRQTTDPVTGELVLLYTQFDKTDAVRARKERQAREQKSEFLAIMAHEIRTPLHQVTGFVDLLDQTQLDKEQKSYVGVLKSSVQGLMTVINDVLDYSKLEAGHMKLENIPYEPLSVAKGSLEAVTASCEERNLYLRLDWDNQIPFKLKNDPNRLRQILLNLLSNAIKFTKEGGITLKTTYLGGMDSQTCGSDASSNIKPQQPLIKFEVRDSGIGIHEEQKRSIFQKYQQANNTIARNYGGTGLGLSICHSLVQMMGGSIGLESELGQGSCFWFVLPAILPTAKDLAGEADEEDGGDTNSFNVSITSNIGINTAGLDNGNDSKPKPDKCGLNILVAEDNKVNQKLVVTMLQRLGHTATVAENGKEAIEMVERWGATADRSLRGSEENGDVYGCHPPFDICLMDIQMPVCDGFEATKRLRSMGYTGLPIYGLTASVVRSDYAELGFNDWLPKPIRMKDLKVKLNQQLELPQAGKGELGSTSSCQTCLEEKQ